MRVCEQCVCVCVYGAEKKEGNCVKLHNSSCTVCRQFGIPIHTKICLYMYLQCTVWCTLTGRVETFVLLFSIYLEIFEYFGDCDDCCCCRISVVSSFYRSIYRVYGLYLMLVMIIALLYVCIWVSVFIYVRMYNVLAEYMPVDGQLVIYIYTYIYRYICM